MGWFIAQSLAFIIIAALLGVAIGIWIGWLVWGHRAKGKHSAERAAAARSDAAAAAVARSDSDTAAAQSDTAADTAAEEADREPSPARAEASTDTGTAARVANGPAGPDPEPAPVSDVGTAPAPAAGGDDDGNDTATNGTASDTAADAAPEDEAAGSAVVAEAEAVARRAAETEAAPAAPAPTAAPVATPTPDDLQRIEGIGPKIAAALIAAGYPTYAAIATATEDELRQAVAGQGIRFAPAAASWAAQAQYLVDSDTDGLQEYQDYLVGGQERRAKFTQNVDYTDVDEIEGATAKVAALAADEAAAAAAAPEPEPEPEPQDLRRIEGIGPKIDATLKAAGYTTYAKVAGASESELREALATGGITFAPAAASWADQAQYLADGDEAGLQEYQDYLVGGQDRAAKFRKNVDYTDVDEIEDPDAKAAALTRDEARTAADSGSAATGPDATATEATA